MAKSFAATVGAWASKSEARITAARRRAVELLGDEMAKTIPQGGRVPFRDGNLYRSLLADTRAMPKIADGPFSGSNVGVITATLRADQPVWLGYQAAYARRMNSGFVGADRLGRVYNQQGHYFVEAAAQQWSEFVKKAATEIQKTVESRK